MSLVGKDRQFEAGQRCSICVLPDPSKRFPFLHVEKANGVTSAEEMEKPDRVSEASGKQSLQLVSNLQKVGHFTTEVWFWVALQRHCGEGTDPSFILRKIVFFLPCDRFILPQQSFWLGVTS